MWPVSPCSRDASKGGNKAACQGDAKRSLAAGRGGSSDRRGAKERDNQGAVGM